MIEQVQLSLYLLLLGEYSRGRRKNGALNFLKRNPDGNQENSFFIQKALKSQEV